MTLRGRVRHRYCTTANDAVYPAVVNPHFPTPRPVFVGLSFSFFVMQFQVVPFLLHFSALQLFGDGVHFFVQFQSKFPSFFRIESLSFPLLVWYVCISSSVSACDHAQSLTGSDSSAALVDFPDGLPVVAWIPAGSMPCCTCVASSCCDVAED